MSEMQFGSFPHQVGLVREANLSEDLTRITWRRVAAIRLYKGNDVAETLDLRAAEALYHALENAVMAAATGPLGDLPDEDGASDG
jgi:hypothetical protein